jgi:outer membrane protein
MNNLKQYVLKMAVCAAVCLLTLLGRNLMAPGTVSAEALPIGVVDYGQLIDKHPDTAKANEALQAEREQVQKEFEAQAPKLSENDKQVLSRQLSQKVLEKRQELLKPIAEKVNAAIKAVMDEKGLSMIVYKNVVFSGGQDITGDVLKKLGVE